MATLYAKLFNELMCVSGQGCMRLPDAPCCGAPACHHGGLRCCTLQRCIVDKPQSLVSHSLQTIESTS